MKLWKKCILLCAALSLCVSVISSAVACGSGQTASSSESPSSSTEEESGSDGDDGGDNVDDGCEHTWGEWTAVSQPDCDTAGEKQRICSKDSSHVDKADIPARGHDYTANNGVCHCGHGPVVPTAASSITYKNKHFKFFIKEIQQISYIDKLKNTDNVLYYLNSLLCQ